MSFYGEMPSMYSVVLNSDHPLIKEILNDTKAHVDEALAPIEAEIKGLNARHAALHQQQDKKKPEEITEEEKKELAECDKNLQEERKKKEATITDYAKGNKKVGQLIDLALLQNGMLKGKALTSFIKRSIDLIK